MKVTVLFKEKNFSEEEIQKFKKIIFQALLREYLKKKEVHHGGNEHTKTLGRGDLVL